MTSLLFSSGSLTHHLKDLGFIPWSTWMPEPEPGAQIFKKKNTEKYDISVLQVDL